MLPLVGTLQDLDRIKEYDKANAKEIGITALNILKFK